MIPTVFRRHNDGTVTDVFEDDCVWVRDGEAASATDLSGDPLTFTPIDVHTYVGVRELFRLDLDVAGVVFTHADGRQAQVTRADFGL
jgi:hypothetical protein